VPETHWPEVAADESVPVYELWTNILQLGVQVNLHGAFGKKEYREFSFA